MPTPCGQWKVVNFPFVDTESGIPIPSAGITRQPVMIQTWLGALWGDLPACQSLAGLPWTPLCGLRLFSSPSPGRRVVLLRLDIGHTDTSTHLNSTIEPGATNHWVTCLVQGDHHTSARRSRCHVDLVSSLMVRPIIWVQMSALLLFHSRSMGDGGGLRQCIARVWR